MRVNKVNLKRRNNIFHTNRKGNKILGIGEDDSFVSLIKHQHVNVILV